MGFSFISLSKYAINFTFQTTSLPSVADRNRHPLEREIHRVLLQITKRETHKSVGKLQICRIVLI
jgi:hypothetical protein